MGDHFQTVVDLDATATDAAELGERARQWLIAEGFVAPHATDCVLGSDLGHPPGPRADEAVTDPAVDPSWHGLWTNGLEVVAEQRVFDSGQGDPAAVTCPHCGTPTRITDRYGEVEVAEEEWERFVPVLQGWDEGRRVRLLCRHCGRAVEPTGWRWADDFFVLAHLGLTFWNWPPLRPEFVAAIGTSLGGHRTVLIGGKL